MQSVNSIKSSRGHVRPASDRSSSQADSHKTHVHSNNAPIRRPQSARPPSDVVSSGQNARIRPQTEEERSTYTSQSNQEPAQRSQAATADARKSKDIVNSMTRTASQASTNNTTRKIHSLAAKESQHAAGRPSADELISGYRVKGQALDMGSQKARSVHQASISSQRSFNGGGFVQNGPPSFKPAKTGDARVPTDMTQIQPQPRKDSQRPILAIKIKQEYQEPPANDHSDDDMGEDYDEDVRHNIGHFKFTPITAEDIDFEHNMQSGGPDSAQNPVQSTKPDGDFHERYLEQDQDLVVPGYNLLEPATQGRHPRASLSRTKSEYHHGQAPSLRVEQSQVRTGRMLSHQTGPQSYEQVYPGQDRPDATHRTPINQVHLDQTHLGQTHHGHQARTDQTHAKQTQIGVPHGIMDHYGRMSYEQQIRRSFPSMYQGAPAIPHQPIQPSSLRQELGPHGSDPSILNTSADYIEDGIGQAQDGGFGLPPQGDETSIEFHVDAYPDDFDDAAFVPAQAPYESGQGLPQPKAPLQRMIPSQTNNANAKKTSVKAKEKVAKAPFANAKGFKDHIELIGSLDLLAIKEECAKKALKLSKNSTPDFSGDYAAKQEKLNETLERLFDKQREELSKLVHLKDTVNEKKEKRTGQYGVVSKQLNEQVRSLYALTQSFHSGVKKRKIRG